jgi:hypothetical protein
LGKRWALTACDGTPVELMLRGFRHVRGRVTIRPMPMVYVIGETGPRSVFHRDPECHHLTKPTRGERGVLREVDLDEVHDRRPCRVCYPDAPRPTWFKRFCPECNTTRPAPCPHNGGVRVIMDHTFRKPTLYHEVGDVYSREKYVWPDRVRFYIPA